MKNKISTWWHSLQTRSSLALLITAAVLIEVNGCVQYFFARDGIRKEVEMRAKTEMKVKNLEILQVVTSVESDINNMQWMVEFAIEHPQYLYKTLEKIVENNPNLTGCALAFEPNYYLNKGQLFEPYALRDTNGAIVHMQIASDSLHNYLNMQWYQQGRYAKEGVWTEPYYDNTGAQGMVCSYVLPVCNSKGDTVAVLCADLSLNWLVDKFGIHSETMSASFLVSREGRFLSCPDKNMIMKYSLDDMSKHYNDSTIKHVNTAMLAGDSGSAEVRDNDGEKGYMYYSPVGGNTGWSMAVVFSDREIFKGLRTVGFNLAILMLLGLALMVFIMWRTVRGFKRLHAVSAEKERIGSELRIASGIQNGMLPKTFPPYPDLDELALYGSLTSAKEVGGDLYDFYVNDNKAFFCIGDVSGKGVPASLVMAVTRSLFRSVSTRIDDPSEIMMQINNAMSEMNENSLFVTLFIGVLDLRTGIVSYSNAGHCPPIALRDEVSIVDMDANIPIGIMPNWQYTLQRTTLKPGQALFLYTDGLTEAENAIHKQFGEARLLKALTNQSDISPRPLIENILQAVHAFVGYAEQSDDLTMFAIQFTKPRIDNNSTSLNNSIILHNDVKEVPQLTEFVEKTAEQAHLDPSVTMSLTLALEEAVANVMEYAYPKGDQGTIEINAHLNNNRLSFTIKDTGTPFDPTQAKEVDISLSAEDREIGGLGIHIIRNIMDSVEYHHNGNQNILTLTKKV